MLAAVAAGLALCSARADIDPAYVEVLKAEIREFNSGSFVVPSNSAAWAPEPEVSSAGTSTESISEDQFSEYLRVQLPGTFILYKRLEPGQKEQIFRDYLANGDLGKVRDSVFKAFGERGRSRRSTIIRNLPSNY